MCVCVCIRLIRHLWLVTLWSEYFYFITYHRQGGKGNVMLTYLHTHTHTAYIIHISTWNKWQRWLAG